MAIQRGLDTQKKAQGNATECRVSESCTEKGKSALNDEHAVVAGQCREKQTGCQGPEHEGLCQDVNHDDLHRIPRAHGLRGRRPCG